MLRIDWDDDETSTEVKPITWDIAKLSAILRAKYTSLKAVDSPQIACATKAEADGFLTNDRRLRSIKEIPIILIKDLWHPITTVKDPTSF